MRCIACLRQTVIQHELHRNETNLPPPPTPTPPPPIFPPEPSRQPALHDAYYNQQDQPNSQPSHIPRCYLKRAHLPPPPPPPCTTPLAWPGGVVSDASLPPMDHTTRLISTSAPPTRPHSNPRLIPSSFRLCQAIKLACSAPAGTCRPRRDQCPWGARPLPWTHI